MLDVVFTLIHVDLGRRELNPLMDYALSHGEFCFVVVKMSITLVGVSLLFLFRTRPMANLGLNLVSVMLTCLLAYHVLLFLA